MSKYGLPLSSEYNLLAVVVVAALEAEEYGNDDAEMVAGTDEDGGVDNVELSVAVEDEVI
jgi:hypothetical protein